jgi:hypothetical protein
MILAPDLGQHLVVLRDGTPITGAVAAGKRTDSFDALELLIAGNHLREGVAQDRSLGLTADRRQPAQRILLLLGEGDLGPDHRIMISMSAIMM